MYASALKFFIKFINIINFIHLGLLVSFDRYSIFSLHSNSACSQLATTAGISQLPNLNQIFFKANWYDKGLDDIGWDQSQNQFILYQESRRLQNIIGRLIQYDIFRNIKKEKIKVGKRNVNQAYTDKRRALMTMIANNNKKITVILIASYLSYNVLAVCRSIHYDDLIILFKMNISLIRLFLNDNISILQLFVYNIREVRFG